MGAHNFFHVSFLKKHVHYPSHVIDWNEIQVDPKGEFHVEPIGILDRIKNVLHNQFIG